MGLDFKNNRKFHPGYISSDWVIIEGVGMDIFGDNSVKVKEKKQRKAEQDRIKRDAYTQEQERIRLEQAKRQKPKS